MRRKSKQLFKPITFNVIDGLEIVKKGPWMRKRTQADLNCYFHPQFNMSPEFNYHVSVWNRKRDVDDRVDHHATLYEKIGGEEKKIHYGFCRSNEAIIWKDEVDRTDPRQMKIIEIFQLFEAEKRKILPANLINRLSVPQQ